MSLKKLTNLTALYIESNRYISESTLKHLTDLTELNISYQHFTSDSVEHLDKLKTLNIIGTKINTISKLTNLTKLYTNGLVPQDQLTKLSHLTLTKECALNDKLTQLTSLSIKSQNVTDNVLIKFSNLTALYLSQNSLITDASLKRLTKLKILDIFLASVSITGSCLMKLQHLTALNICGTPFPVKELLIHPSLRHLASSCHGAEIEKIKNAGILLYTSSEWLKRFSPSPLHVLPPIST
jgi:hypothetical protein